MRLSRLLTVGWVVGVLAARALEGWPTCLLVLGCAIAVTGLLGVGRGHLRLGLLAFALGVAALTASPRPRMSVALLDGAVSTSFARVDGVARRSARGISLPVTLAEVRRGDRLVAASGRVRVSVPALREPLAPDDRVLFEARFAAPGRACNPGACEGRWRAEADHVDAYATVSDARRIARIDAAGTTWRARLHHLRVAMRGVIEARLPTEEGALVSALVVGERAGLDPAMEARFRAAGVTHLLSISGLHLAFAAGLLYALLRFLLARLMPQLGRAQPRDRWAALLALPIVAAYTELTGAEIATLRASIVVGVAFGAVITGRRARGVDALSFAALVLLIECPASLFDPSFQLSFVAALATMAIGGRSQSAGDPPRSTLLRWVLSLSRTARATLLASFAATLATAPLTALHFSELAPAGIVSNAIAIPLTEMGIVPVALVGALLGAARAGLGDWLLDLSGFLTSVLIGFVEKIASFAPVWSVPAPSMLCLFVSAAALAFIGAGAAPRARRLAIGAGIVGLVLVAEGLWQRVLPALEIVFLDVGQGDGAVVLLPRRGAIVIDGGGGQADPGGRVLVPFLLRRGVTRIERLVLSHPHPDHSGGLVAVLERFPVGEIWTNGQETRDPATLALLSAAAARGIPVRRPRVDRVGEVGLELLAPRGSTAEIESDPLASENDNSLVLALSYAGRRVLFAGDIERGAEAALACEEPASIDVLKVPHHGSRTSSTAELLDRLRPRLAVVSLADGNRYRFPHPDVVARYRARGIALYRTDLDGAVTLRIGASGAMSMGCARPGGCATR